MMDVEQLLEALNARLIHRPEILFAYVHGSLVDGIMPFRDVDVALYVDPAWGREHDLFTYETKLAVELTRALRSDVQSKVPVDVHVLNTSPLSFQLHVIRDGRLLFVHDEESWFNFREHTIRHAMDMAPLIALYRKELVR